jgi:hypothetical protein
VIHYAGRGTSYCDDFSVRETRDSDQPGDANTGVSSQSILVNGDFENGETGWGRWSRGEQVVDGEGVDGSRGARIPGPTEESQIRDVEQAGAVVGGQTYRCSAMIRTENVGNNARVRTRWFDAASEALIEPFIGKVKGTTPWTIYTETIVAPKEATKAKIHMRTDDHPTKPGMAWFDNISCVPQQ